MTDYTERDSKIGKCQGGAQNLSQAKPSPKQLNLKGWAMQEDLKVCGCPTLAEPIFESRAVYLLVNFGGPRNTDEIEPFLRELLCDRDVIRTKFPSFFHNFLFGRIARKRAVAVRHDYEKIGGSSPIYADTESLARSLSETFQQPVATFHRYIPATHKESLKKIESSTAQEIRVLPLFPQFSYATTGSIARFFHKNLSPKTVSKLRWIQSYPAHPGFVGAFQRRIRSFLDQHRLLEEETLLLFSAHGLPQSFIDAGDIYQSECELSFQTILKGFPKALGLLAYQSQFGRDEWLRPYTKEVCEEISAWNQGRKNIVLIPLSFTTDHLETLFEIEYLYVSRIREQGLSAFRCPALNLQPDWIEALASLFLETNLCANATLIR